MVPSLQSLCLFFNHMYTYVQKSFYMTFVFFCLYTGVMGCHCMCSYLCVPLGPQVDANICGVCRECVCAQVAYYM